MTCLNPWVHGAYKPLPSEELIQLTTYTTEDALKLDNNVDDELKFNVFEP